MTDRYTKVLLTMMCLALIWFGVKDTPLEPVVSAQNQGWDAPLQEWDDTALTLGLPNPNLALPAASGPAYVCSSVLYSGTAFEFFYGDYGYLRLYFRSEPNCGGSFIGIARVFSEGATHSWSHSSYLYREAALMSVYENTARAAVSGQRVTYYRCSDDKTQCIKYLYFRNVPAV